MFEQYRKVSLENFELDPLWFYSTPGLSWEAALKFTKVELDLIDCPEKYTFLEKALRGGVSVVPHRYAKSINHYINPEIHKSDPDQSYLFMLDYNGLYSYIMLSYLPCSDFEWIEDSEIENFNINKYTETSEYGFFAEVDLIYPRTLHNDHHLFPLAASKLAIPYEDLSSFQKEIMKKVE